MPKWKDVAVKTSEVCSTHQWMHSIYSTPFLSEARRVCSMAVPISMHLARLVFPSSSYAARGFNEPLMTDKQSRRGGTSYVISLLGLLCHCLFPKERLPHGFWYYRLISAAIALPIRNSSATFSSFLPALLSGPIPSPRLAREAMIARRWRHQHPRARMSSGNQFATRCGLEALQALAQLV